MLEISSYKILNLINVYFPCYEANVQYSVELGYCLGFIEDILQDNNNVIVLGDFNFECDMSNSGYKQCVDMFSNYSIRNCDDLCNSPDRVTYCNGSIGQSSFIDHFFVSNDLRPQLVSFQYTTLEPILVIIAH